MQIYPWQKTVAHYASKYALPAAGLMLSGTCFYHEFLTRKNPDLGDALAPLLLAGASLKLIADTANRNDTRKDNLHA